MADVTVIGIDPGSLRTGWGVLCEKSGQIALVDCGIIRTSAEEKNFSTRLAMIYRELHRILERLQPDEAAIEQVFQAKNAASALKLGQARGVAVAACAAHNLPIFDYEPTMVKKNLVGVGRAEKQQVAFMVRNILAVREAKWPLDTSDALAVGICHLNSRRFLNLAALQNKLP